MKILLGVTGGIAAYKSCDVISGLRANGHEVKVIMTKNAMQFITPLTLSTLSGHEVMSDMWQERRGIVEHIEIAKWADIVLVYPATMNIIAKFAAGLADDLLSTVYLALPRNKIKIICPAANTEMYHNTITKQNIQTVLNGGRVFEFGPIEGKLACGDFGMGKAAKPRDVVEYVQEKVEEMKRFYIDKIKETL